MLADLIINDPPKILLFSLCNISNTAAMQQNINVEANEIVDVMQRERKIGFKQGQ